MKLAISIFLFLFILYLILGIIFAIIFLLFGISKVDHGAKSSSVITRLFLFPGSVAFWIPMLIRWIHAKSHKHDKKTSKST
ncbi:MAG: hypothetical protein ACEPOV_09175 [Hyphomicrobiales bacterium]